MKLYHFTALHLWPAIHKQGLTQGFIPDMLTHGQVITIPNRIWLTTNSDWDQSWQKWGNLPYRRNAVRIRVRVPGRQKKRLFPWSVLSKQIHPHMVKVLNSFGDPQCWWIYCGHINRNWFVNWHYSQEALQQMVKEMEDDPVRIEVGAS